MSSDAGAAALQIAPFTDGGFTLVNPNICTVWRYENAECGDGILHQWNGQVRFQSRGRTTAFHGEIRNDNPSMMTGKFDYAGRGGHHKSFTVYRRSRDVFKGWDSRHRVITMTRMSTLISAGGNWAEM